MKRHYAITFLPDADTASVCVQVSEQFRGSASDPEFSLGRERNLPHLSLFHLMLEDEKVGSCRDRLREIAAALSGSAGDVGTLTGFEIRGGILFWNAELTPSLLHWHLAVLERCEPLRSGRVRTPYQPKGARLKAWQDTGYVYAGPSWRPRITIQRLRERGNRDIPSKGADSWRWTAEKLVLAEVDDRGVITSRDTIVAEIALT